MKTYQKIFLVSFILLLVWSAIYGALKAFDGNFLSNAPFFLSGMVVLMLFALIFLTIKAIKYIWLLSVLGVFLLLGTGCDYAKSNQQVLVSSDCGMSWKQVNAGDAIPKGTLSPCYMKVVIPNFPMQGDSKFIGNLKGKVKVNVEIDYDYSIINGLAFIKEAKSLGKANVDADSQEAINSDFESAENRVIEKRIREVAKQLFLDEDIVDMEQADLEEKLEMESNKLLEKYGVKLNFLTLTFIPDEQTRQAIDVATAVRIYESKGIREVGEKIMTAKAGATKITVENKNESTPKQ